MLPVEIFVCRRPDPAGTAIRRARLEPGQVGFLFASPGVGKSALVAELAVERALENQMVLQVAINEPVEYVLRFTPILAA